MNYMRKKRLILLSIALVWALSPLPGHAQVAATENVGFIPSNIWYSKEPFFDGDKIRIYTVIYNSSDQDIAGTVAFSDNGAEIGTTNFSITQGRVQDLWVNWTATAGAHKISASIKDTTTQLPSGEKVAITIANAQAGGREQVVEKDIDHDGVSDTKDADVDGDGISNTEEKKMGTDPFAADTDGDGKKDGEDAEPLVSNKTSVAQTVDRVKEEVLPVAIDSGSKVLQKVEAFRTSQTEAESERLDAAKVSLVKARSASGEKKGSTEWVAWLLVALHTFLYFLFRIQLAFYAAILIGSFLAVRFLWKKFSGDRFDL